MSDELVTVRRDGTITMQMLFAMGESYRHAMTEAAKRNLSDGASVVIVLDAIKKVYAAAVAAAPDMSQRAELDTIIWPPNRRFEFGGVECSTEEAEQARKALEDIEREKARKANRRKRKR